MNTNDDDTSAPGGTSRGENAPSENDGLSQGTTHLGPSITGENEGTTYFYPSQNAEGITYLSSERDGFHQGTTHLGPSAVGETEGSTYLTPEQDRYQGITYLVPATEPGSTTLPRAESPASVQRVTENYNDAADNGLSSTVLSCQYRTGGNYRDAHGLSGYLTPHDRKRATIARSVGRRDATPRISTTRLFSESFECGTDTINKEHTNEAITQPEPTRWDEFVGSEHPLGPLLAH